MYNKIIRCNAVRVATSELEALVATPGPLARWQVTADSKRLVRECTFSNFEQTWGFLTAVSMRAHLWGHHPTITTTYTDVKVELSTHDLDPAGISDIDVKMAKKIETTIGQYTTKGSLH